MPAMKALVMREYGKLTFEDVPMPEPGSDEVLVRVRACSVCGSDVHGFDGSTGRRRPPVIMGHEAAGIIEACGPDVKGYRVGDRVTFDSTIYCGRCEKCRTGLVNLCPSRRVLGVSCGEYNRNGCFAEYVNIPEHILYRLPDGVTFVQASMVEPLSVAYHAATRTPIGPEDTVAVVGVGTIGLLTLQVARALGAKRVVAVDIDEARLKVARENGADACVNSADPDAAARIRAAAGGDGVDIAFDATGIDATVNLCIGCVRTGGTAVLIGNLAPEVRIPLQRVVTGQISLLGSCASAGEYPQCLELIASGRVNVDAMISRVAPLREGDLWMRKIYNREDGLTKICFDCTEV